MSEKVLYFETEKGVKGFVKRKWFHVKKGLADAKDEVLQFVKDNPAEAAAIASASVFVIKKGSRYAKDRAEERRRDCEFWDPSAGMYAKSKRPLTEKQKKELYRKKRETGKSYMELLQEAGLSKR